MQTTRVDNELVGSLENTRNYHLDIQSWPSSIFHVCRVASLVLLSIFFWADCIPYSSFGF